MLKHSPTLQHLAIDTLVRSQYQPRQYFDQEKLQELADSIKKTNGLLQPIVVRPLTTAPHEAKKYEIVAGERRWRAAQLAGLHDVSCLINNYSDEQALQVAIIENTQRDDLNPIEAAQSYQRLIDEFQYLHEEVAAAVGKSRAAITNALRLLKLNTQVQQLLITKQISEGHGKILASIALDKQIELAINCIQKEWSVRRLEKEAKKLQMSSTQALNTYNDANMKNLEQALSEHIGNRIQIECEERGGGYLHIRFNNIDELEGHFERIGFKYK